MDIMFFVTVGEASVSDSGVRTWRPGHKTKSGLVTGRQIDSPAIDEAVKQFERLLRQAVVEQA